MGSLQEQYLSSDPSFRGFSSTGSSVSTYNKDGLSLVRHGDTTDQSEEPFLRINQSRVRTTATGKSEARVVKSDQSSSNRFSQINQSDETTTNSRNYVYGELSQTLLGSERFNNRQSSSGEFFDLADGSGGRNVSTSQTPMKSDEGNGGGDDRENMSTLVLQEENDDSMRYGYVFYFYMAELQELRNSRNYRHFVSVQSAPLTDYPISPTRHGLTRTKVHSLVK